MRILDYNLELDTIKKDDNLKEYYLKEEPFERYYLYKVNRGTKEYSCISDDAVEAREKFYNLIERAEEYNLKDPDTGGSLLLQDVLRKMYINIGDNGKKLLEQEYMSNGSYYYSDTMNSVQTIMNQINKSFIKENADNEEIRSLFKNGKLPRSTSSSGIFLAANNDVTNLYVWTKENYPFMEEYVSSYHKIGNYIFVPKGFNAGRYTVTKDFMDLTLYIIYSYFKGNNEYIKRVFKKDETLETCKKWLDVFGSWDGFVEGNLLQPFVNKESDCYGCPKEFWEGHIENFKNGENILPKAETSEGKEQCNEFLENVCRMMRERGKLIERKLEGGK